MKSYFIRLFDYNLFACRQINQLLQSRPAEGPEKLMAHLLSAEQIWLARCKVISTEGFNVWPKANSVSFDSMISNNYTQWTAFLSDLPENSFENVIKYHNQAGEAFENKLSDIIAHVINHGTHTRAQIGQQLKMSENDKLPITDYTYYLRQSEKN